MTVSISLDRMYKKKLWTPWNIGWVALVLIILFGWQGYLVEDSWGASGGAITGKVHNRWAKVAMFPTIVYIERVPGAGVSASNAIAVMDQVNRKFVPRVLPVHVGTEVEFRNNDDITHDVYCDIVAEGDYGIYGPGMSFKRRFNTPGFFKLECIIHPRMTGYIAVMQNRYYAVTDSEGGFIIKDAPDGDWTLRVWNERMTESQRALKFDVKVTAGQTSRVDMLVK